MYTQPHRQNNCLLEGTRKDRRLTMHDDSLRKWILMKDLLIDSKVQCKHQIQYQKVYNALTTYGYGDQKHSRIKWDAKFAALPCHFKCKLCTNHLSLWVQFKCFKRSRARINNVIYTWEGEKCQFKTLGQRRVLKLKILKRPCKSPSQDRIYCKAC